MGLVTSHMNGDDVPQPADKEMMDDDAIPKLPLPEPPMTCKADIYNSVLIENVDKHALQMSRTLTHLNGSYEELAHHLTKGCKTDLERVRALFVWLTSRDISSFLNEARARPKEGSPLSYLHRINDRKGNKAFLFSYLCLAAGVPCVLITGINKSSVYKLGAPIDRQEIAAQWNAVLIDNQWRLVDTFWGSTATHDRAKDWILLQPDKSQSSVVIDLENHEEHHVNEFYFLTDPKMLISTHLPNDEQWQLLETPIDIDRFEKQAYLRERFFDLDAQFVGNSLKDCMNEAPHGEIEIVFGIPPTSASFLEFSYLVYQERGLNVPDEYPLKRYVLFEKKTETVNFTIQFPVTGRFKVDIFAQHRVEHTRKALMASYIVDAIAKSNVQPLPDQPEIGWGAGLEMEEKGLQTDQTESVIETQTGLAELRFRKTNPLSVMQAMRHNNLDDWLLKQISVIFEEGDEVVVKLRLPTAGQYGFKLYADDPDNEGELSNICNYLLKSINPNASPNPFPKLYHWMLGKGRYAEELQVTREGNWESQIKTEDGKLRLAFTHPPEQELMLQLTGRKQDTKTLAESVTRIEEDGKTVFEINLPEAGEYGINMYANDRKSKTASIHHVHSCVIESTQATQQDIPSEPMQGETEKEKIEIETFRMVETVPLPPGPFENPLVGSLQRQQAQDALDTTAVTEGKEHESSVFKVKLSDLGQYDLEVFEKLPRGALVAVSAMTLVRRQVKDGEDSEKQVKGPDQQDDEDTRRRKEIETKYATELKSLRARAKGLDIASIEKAIDAIRNKGDVPDELEQEVADAENLLKEYKKHRDALQQVMEKGNLEALEKAVKAVENAHPAVRKNLEREVRLADERLVKLRRIEKHRHAILKLKKTTIAEIRAYSTPPEQVYSVMRVTFTILGDPEHITKDWHSLKTLIGKTGPMSLLRRVLMYDVTTMTQATRARCLEMLKGLDIYVIRDVSLGAAAFYIWAIGMIEAEQ